MCIHFCDTLLMILYIPILIDFMYIFGLGDKIMFLNQVLFHQLKHNQLMTSYVKFLRRSYFNPFLSNQDPNNLRI